MFNMSTLAVTLVLVCGWIVSDASAFSVGTTVTPRTARPFLKTSKTNTYLDMTKKAEATTEEEEATEEKPAPVDDLAFVNKVEKLYANAPKTTQYDVMIKLIFPGALSNEQLQSRVVKQLGTKGYTPKNTLLATSLCCDELARQLESDFVKVYGKNFNLGGLAGFPFAGRTGFGAMAAHIPDDGSVLIIYGPHVGVATTGGVGKVERSGIELVDNCCGSAIAASNYLSGITDGGAVTTVNIKQFSDFQQGAVQQLILPHGKRLGDAEDRMRELPFCLYDSQDVLLREIVKKGAGGVKNNIALLGGIQINTAPEALDYFVPLRFDYMNNKGEVVEDMLESITYV